MAAEDTSRGIWGTLALRPEHEPQQGEGGLNAEGSRERALGWWSGNGGHEGRALRESPLRVPRPGSVMEQILAPKAQPLLIPGPAGRTSPGRSIFADGVKDADHPDRP